MIFPRRTGRSRRFCRAGKATRNLASRKRVARRTSVSIAAGGSYGGGISEDGRFVEFTNNRRGSVLVQLENGRPGPPFPGPLEGFRTVRSSDGVWAIAIPDHNWVDDQPFSIFVRDGMTGYLKSRLPVELDEETFSSYMTRVAVCGNRAVLGRQEEITVHDLPSGRIVARYPIGPNESVLSPRLTACAPDGKTAGVVVGSRLVLLRLPLQ